MKLTLYVKLRIVRDRASYAGELNVNFPLFNSIIFRWNRHLFEEMPTDN